MNTISMLHSELQHMADKEKALILSRFFKTGVGEYGEGDQFLGIKVPELRKVAKRFCDLKLADIKKLLYSKGLIGDFIKGVDDLIIVLNSLGASYEFDFLKLLCEKGLIGDILKGVDNLVKVLNCLRTFDGSYGFDFLKLLHEKGLIGDFIKGVDDLIIVLNFLGDYYEFNFLKLLCEKGLIGDFIKGVDDLIIVLNHLGTFEGFNFLKLLCEKGLIGDIIKGVDDLVKVLNFLESFLRSELLQLLCDKELINKIIESVDDFFKLRRELSDLGLNQFMEPIGNLWFRKRVNNNEDLVKFLNACNDNDMYCLYAWLDKKKLAEELTKSAEDLVYVLLNCTRQCVVLDLLNKDWFLKHINTKEDLVNVLNVLNSYHLRDKVLGWVGDKLPEFISSEETLVEVLEKLNEPSRCPVLEKLGTEMLVELINNKDVLTKVMKLISATNLDSFIDVLGGKDRLNQLIGGDDEMTDLLNELTVLQRYVFLTKLNTRLEDRIKNVDELAEFMNQLCSELFMDDTEILEDNFEHLKKTFDKVGVNEWFAKLIKNTDDKISVLKKLTQYSSSCFLACMEDKELELINTTSERYPGFFDNSRTRQLIINEETSSVVPRF